MRTPDFVYVTYIAAPADRVWAALVDSEFVRQFYGFRIETEWRAGAKFRFVRGDGSTDSTGEIVEFEPLGDVTRLTITETHDPPADAEFLEGGRTGWPVIASRLETLLETGRPMPKFSMPA